MAKIVSLPRDELLKFTLGSYRDILVIGLYTVSAPSTRVVVAISAVGLAGERNFALLESVDALWERARATSPLRFEFALEHAANRVAAPLMNAQRVAVVRYRG